MSRNVIGQGKGVVLTGCKCGSDYCQVTTQILMLITSSEPDPCDVNRAIPQSGMTPDSEEVTLTAEEKQLVLDCDRCVQLP